MLTQKNPNNNNKKKKKKSKNKRNFLNQKFLILTQKSSNAFRYCLNTAMLFFILAIIRQFLSIKHFFITFFSILS